MADEPKNTRAPIISVLGHVDHGKTTLLDWIRGTLVASREAGGITQHIGATDVPFDAVKKICGPLLAKISGKVNIRGLLFIDTPGHEAFTNLRRRGGSVSDLAILVVDINEGLMPQSIEAIQILKNYRTPFVVAANKVDAIAGWRKGLAFDAQPERTREEFYKRFYNLVGGISEQGFDTQLFNEIKDFRREVAIVPISAKSGEGVPELLMILMGLAQQYLKDQLSVEMNSPAKGTILEVKEERGLGTTIDVIIYDGVMRKNDSLVVGAREPIVTKVKALLRPKPLDEMRDPKERFQNVNAVYAASGVKIAAPNLEKALAGAPIYVGGAELAGEVKKEIENVEINTNKLGLTIKADTIGSLEALVKLLTEKSIPIRKATIGKISNTDVIEASSVKEQDKFLGSILAFNSEILKEAKTLAEDKKVRIFESRIIYKLIEDYEDYVKKEKERERAEKEGKVNTPAKLRLIPKCVFRQSKPAIVGVDLLAGTLNVGSRLMRVDGKVVGRIKEMQKEKENVKSATAPGKVAISVENVTMGRQLNEGDTVYVYVTPDDMAQINKEDLTEEEKQVLKEMRDLRKARQAGG
ncbi:MAG: translation initiation factor IF-2 [Candidatus Altiarchaeota archaeon]|nr:translation initiation factor IF-2 [Candidatus Altiarchaeota archaeon]